MTRTTGITPGVGVCKVAARGLPWEMLLRERRLGGKATDLMSGTDCLKHGLQCSSLKQTDFGGLQRTTTHFRAITNDHSSRNRGSGLKKEWLAESSACVLSSSDDRVSRTQMASYVLYLVFKIIFLQSCRRCRFVLTG